MNKHCLVLAFLTFLASDIKGVPRITSFTKVATLNEGALNNEVLSTIVCTSDPAGDPTRTYVRNVQPGSPCANCFTILDCGGAECLQYRTGVGRLDHDSSSRYLVTVSCEDTARDTATEVIQIVIIPNQPPKFDPDTLETTFEITATLGPGDEVGQVPAIDEDGDLLSYSLSVIPSSAHSAFSIQSDGTIVAHVDLRTLCRSFVTLEVTVTDGHNTVGPKVVAVSFRDNRVKPIATNLNTEIQIPESSTGRIYTYLFVPNNALTYTVTSTSADGFAQYTSNNENLDVATATTLNYEVENLRVTDLLIRATDGYCESDVYTLRVKVTDVNEVPVISDHRTSIEICEGRTEFLPPFTMADEDEDDTHIWTYFGGNNDDGFFFVHPETGVLGTNIDYDVDPDYDKPRRYSGTFQYRIQVTDKGGLSATATVTATFLDCNDNAPRFTRAFFTYTANECTAPGSVLGRLTGQDADSNREGNNQLTFSGAAGAIDIGDTGNVIVTKPLAAGSVVVFDAYVTDQGQTPGPLRSEQPAKVSVIFGVCPEPVVSDSTTAASADSNERRRGNNLPWIIIAAILGTLLLGLLSFMLWRYWSMIGEACGNINCSKACRGRPRRRAPKNITPKRGPADKPASPPAPKRQHTPPGPSFLFGFWKERYPNDDFKGQPDRKKLPTPADMNQHDTNTYDPVDIPEDTSPPPPPKARKFCAIL